MAATIQYRYSGGASNNTPDDSLGGVSSSEQLASEAMNNLFDNVSPDEAQAGHIDYRAVDLFNAGDAAAEVAVAYVDPDSSSADTTIDMGIEAEPVGSTTSIADEVTAPVGVVFAHHDPDSKLSLPNIPASGYCRLWVRRTVSAGANNTANDSATFKVDYA